MPQQAPSSFRRVLASVLLGIGVGAMVTLVGLKVEGVPLVPGVNSPAFNKFFEAYQDLHGKYYRQESEQTLLNGAIDGMTKALGDPFSDYFAPADATQFQNMLSGTYVGIGVTVVQSNGDLVVQSVVKGGPAGKAGVKPQDAIVAVNGSAIHGMSIEKATSLILGPRGTKVTLTVQRKTAKRLLKFTITRDKVARQTVYTRMLGPGLGYLQITVVADHTADEVKQAVATLKQQGAKQVIVDVRGNPGGYLDQALQIAGDFIPQGKLVVQTEDRQHHIDKLTSPGPGWNVPVVVIMDKDTASAAEILAAALHDDMGAALVGTKSFGKGTVQETQAFTDGSSLKYTVAKWLTPTGAWIHGKGLTPTQPVDLPAYTSLAPLDEAKLPLKSNQNNADVQILQSMLRALKYSVDRTDGYFDANTVAAVKKFQADTGLTPSGVVDAATADHLQSAFEALLAKSDTQLQRAEQIARG